MGFALGARSAQTTKGPRPSTSPTAPAKSKDAQEDSDSEEEDVADGDLSAVKPGLMEPCKMVSSLLMMDRYMESFGHQVLVVRTDLGMSSGKIAAQ